MDERIKPGITRDNHFVPQALLRRWSTDGTNLHAYRLLVPDARVPEWEQKAIRGLAYQRDLYTLVADDKEVDDFERWIHTEFEQPAELVIPRVLADEKLTRGDWHTLVRFLAAQDVRTPRSFIESNERWQRTMSDFMNDQLRKGVEAFKAMKRTGKAPAQPAERNEFSELFRVSVEHPEDKSLKEANVVATLTTGRQFWVAQMRHVLRMGRPMEALLRHQWSIAQPASDEEWPLTDHPVVKLNYYGSGKYDFRGGWGKRGTEIMMPLSPRHLLYTHVGRNDGRRVQLSMELTKIVQRLLVERAHRWVFATKPFDWITALRPRKVDPNQFSAEAQAWQEWHPDQSRSERDLAASKTAPKAIGR